MWLVVLAAAVQLGMHGVTSAVCKTTPPACMRVWHHRSPPAPPRSCSQWCGAPPPLPPAAHLEERTASSVSPALRSERNFAVRPAGPSHSALSASLSLCCSRVAGQGTRRSRSRTDDAAQTRRAGGARATGT